MNYHAEVVSRREHAIEFASHHSDIESRSEGPIDTPEIGSAADDEFSGRMRTAAVMLAQLYQQQQKELAAHKPARHRRSITISNMPMNRTRGETTRTSHSTPSTPQVVDKRGITKMRNDFEEIQSRVLKEMSASEAARLASMSNHKPPKYKHPQVDEILTETDEIELRQGLEKDEEDPSGIKL